MSEVMVRNSTQRELEVNYQDYDLEHSQWAVERLLSLMNEQLADIAEGEGKVFGLERDVDEMDDKLNIKESEIETLQDMVDGLKDQLKEAS